MTVRTAVATDDSSAKRVLVVAHGWSGVESIRQALQGKGIHIAHVAESRSEAMSFLEHTEVDVVVLHDEALGAPSMDVARELLGRRPSVRLVMCGPSADGLLLRQLLAVGVREWVWDNPPDQYELIDAIQRQARDW